jgi:hypothetical protein
MVVLAERGRQTGLGEAALAEAFDEKSPVVSEAVELYGEQARQALSNHVHDGILAGRQLASGRRGDDSCRPVTIGALP